MSGNEEIPLIKWVSFLLGTHCIVQIEVAFVHNLIQMCACVCLFIILLSLIQGRLQEILAGGGALSFWADEQIYTPKKKSSAKKRS